MRMPPLAKGISTHETDTRNIAGRRSWLSNDAVDCSSARSTNSVRDISSKGAFEFLRVLLAAAELKPLLYALAPGQQYSSYAFEFTAARNVSHYILKVMFPLVLIVIMSWAVFWLDPIHSSAQISIAITSMLTLIAYRFATDNQLPRLPYMTRLDAFILMGTVLIFFSLIEVITTTVLETNHRVRLAKTIDCCCRLIFPAIFVSAAFAIFAHPRG